MAAIVDAEHTHVACWDFGIKVSSACRLYRESSRSPGQSAEADWNQFVDIHTLYVGAKRVTYLRKVHTQQTVSMSKVSLVSLHTKFTFFHHPPIVANVLDWIKPPVSVPYISAESMNLIQFDRYK